MSQPDHENELQVLSMEVPEPSRTNDTLVIGTAIGAAVGGVAFALTLLLGWPLPVYGTLLAVSFFLLAIAVRHYFADRYPEIDAAQPRDHDEDDDDGPVSEIKALPRRSVLSRVLVGASGVFGASLLALIPSLGPKVGDQLNRTAWRNGRSLVTSEGDQIRPEQVARGGILTVWPEGHIGNERSAAVLLRLNDAPEAPTNLDWTVDGQVVAYSKICTHAGCPVALFRERAGALFCPCHQSTFDANRGAIPTFGPAARALPQLPLGLDSDGFLVALGDFASQVGPAFG